MGQFSDKYKNLAARKREAQNEKMREGIKIELPLMGLKARKNYHEIMNQYIKDRNIIIENANT